MTLPAAFTSSLQGIPGYDATSFREVHESGVQVTSLRYNPAKPVPVSAEAIPVPWCSQGYYLPQRPSFTLDPLFHAGTYYVQEASSMFLEAVLRQTADLSHPLLALDLCAAPGGKSTLLQSVLGSNSLLVSNEVIQTRVPVLKENLIKWGLPQTVVTHNDPRDFSRVPGLFDVLVVDAPCSGSGLFRRDPAAISEWTPGLVQLCSARQQRILADSWSCLKEDGLLIYSTCSYSREENEALLDWLAATFPVASCRLEVPAEWNITEVQSESGQWGYRFWPHRLQCEGFFIAAFRKQETATTPVLKSKTVALPTKREVAVAAPWLRHAAAMNWIWQGRQLAAVPARWWETIRLLQQQLQVRYAGVEVGTLVRDELLPDHPLALSVELRPDLPAVDLSREEALQYLRKQELSLATNGRGWTLARYAGYNLGWMKLLGNRINNYYPKEWRILK